MRLVLLGYTSWLGCTRASLA